MYLSTMPARAASFNGARGLGSAASAGQQIQIGGTIAASTATAILGSMTAGGATAIFGITSAAVPVIGAALVAATLLVQYLVTNSGCGQTCIETSQWANQAAAALQKVLDAYFALPAPRTEAQKAVAIANFQAIWAQLVAACGQPGTGNAGVRCISDRQAGACTWKQKYAPVYPGEPNIGECWNWFSGYLNPIQQDPVVPDPAPTVASVASSVSDTVSSAFSTASPIAGISLGVLALAGLDYFAIEPRGEFCVPDADGLAQLVVFAAMSMVIGWLIYKVRQRSYR